MAAFLNKVHYLSKRIKTNQIHSWQQQFFHTNHGLFCQPTFNEKPEWLKKFKLKQAAMQKDDGRPVYLKKGTPDKILFNLTFGMCLIGIFWSFRILLSLDDPPKQ